MLIGACGGLWKERWRDVFAFFFGWHGRAQPRGVRSKEVRRGTESKRRFGQLSFVRCGKKGSGELEDAAHSRVSLQQTNTAIRSSAFPSLPDLVHLIRFASGALCRVTGSVFADHHHHAHCYFARLEHTSGSKSSQRHRYTADRAEQTPPRLCRLPNDHAHACASYSSTFLQ